MCGRGARGGDKDSISQLRVGKQMHPPQNQKQDKEKNKPKKHPPGM